MVTSVRIIGEFRPRPCDPITAYTTDPSSIATKVWPTGSNRRVLAPCDSGTTTAAQMIAVATSGTLTKNTERQPRVSTRTPGDDRAGRERQARHRTEHADRSGRAARCVKVLATIAIAVRVKHRAADRLESACCDQPPDSRRKPAEQGGTPGRYHQLDLDWIAICTELRATGTPIKVHPSVNNKLLVMPTTDMLAIQRLARPT